METPPHPTRGARAPLYAAVFNRYGRLRSGWRFLAFACAFVFVSAGAFKLYSTALRLAPALREAARGRAGFFTPTLINLVAATLIGWACLRAFEDLPARALGWARHRRWLRDLGLGALVGGGSLCAALLPGVLAGGTRFFPSGASVGAMADTLFVSALIFLLGAAGEEVVFRGYPLQTMLRSWPAWLALIPTSVVFAAIHLDNPNAVRGFTFLNTVLAGVWLAVAYLRTRSLWFPLGVHWGWNWLMGAVLGVPVSGITQLTPAPLLRATDAGPTWLTGGHYGVEGGAACTVALVVSTLFIWRTRLVAPDPEMMRLTASENPAAGTRREIKIDSAGRMDY